MIDDRMEKNGIGGKGPTAEMVGKNEGKSIAGKYNIGHGVVVAYYIRIELVLSIDLTWCRVLSQCYL